MIAADGAAVRFSTRLTSHASRLTRPGLPRAARLTAAVMFIGFVAAAAVEPAANGPDPVLPWWADVVSTVTQVALLASWAALATGRRAGLWLGAIAGVGMTTATVACSAVDHHVIAGWWWAQLAISLGIAAATVGLLAVTRPSPRR